MPSLSATEILVVLAVALVVLGPQKLPEAARQIGKVLGDLRRMASGFQNEMRQAFDEVSDGVSAPAPLAPPPPQASRVVRPPLSPPGTEAKPSSGDRRPLSPPDVPRS